MTLTPDDQGTPTASGWEARRRRVARHIENEAIALFAEQGYANRCPSSRRPTHQRRFRYWANALHLVSHVMVQQALQHQHRRVDGRVSVTRAR